MGPLEGIRIIELQGIGPGPFCAMMLADMGAEVIRVDRPGARGGLPREPRYDTLARGRRSVRIDLKLPDGVEALLRMTESADGLIEGFRPGVIERLGLGPDVLLERNPRLVIGRMTGWGQEGPIAHTRGTTSTTSRWPERCSTSGARALRRCRPSTWSETSAVAACSSPLAWSAGS